MGERALIEMLWALNLSHEKKPHKLNHIKASSSNPSLAKGREIIKEHMLMKSLRNICVEK